MPRQKKLPSRTCVGCRIVKPKKEMLRIVRAPSGEVTFDETGKRSGRGVYICPQPECLEKAIKTKSLSRSLQTETPSEVVTTLQEQLRGTK